MAVQTLGADGVTLVGVDATKKAMRVSLNPMEVLAWQSLGAKSGLVTGVAAAGPLFSFRNISANPVIVRRVGAGFITTTAFSTAQIVDFWLVVARAFTVSDSGGTAISITGSNGKHRTSLAIPTSVDARIATTAALTAGTRTLDANAFGQIAGWSGAVGQGIAPTVDNLLSHTPGDHPLVLAQNEGFIVRPVTALGPAGVGNFYVNMEFAEAAAY